jgi:hypothetical protein
MSNAFDPADARTSACGGRLAPGVAPEVGTMRRSPSSDSAPGEEGLRTVNISTTVGVTPF